MQDFQDFGTSSGVGNDFNVIQYCVKIKNLQGRQTYVYFCGAKSKIRDVKQILLK